MLTLPSVGSTRPFQSSMCNAFFTSGSAKKQEVSPAIHSARFQRCACMYW